MTIRVLIVDDHEAIRTGVRCILAGDPKWEVCGEAADGEHALQEFARLVPDIVILDLSLPVKNGFDVAAEMRQIAPPTKIVLLSIHDMPATAETVGADAFVLKSSGNAALLAALERVLQRRAVAVNDPERSV